MSVPSSAPVKPAASAAAEPPDEPPGTCADDHGLFVVPNSSLNAWLSPHQRGRLVLPKTIAPGRLQPGDRRRVRGGHVVRQLHRAAGRSDALGRDRVLDRHRQSVQRPDTSPRASASSAAAAAGERVDVERDDRVHAAAIETVDALEVDLEQLAGGDLLTGAPQ